MDCSHYLKIIIIAIAIRLKKLKILKVCTAKAE
jgi:hypothetical protein